MAFTEFCCRSGGSNLNAGTRTGNSTEPGTAADFTYASGTWVAATRTFTPVSGNPSTDGVAAGDFGSVYVDGASVTGYVARVASVTATTIVFSTVSCGTAPADGVSTRTCRIGGAWKGPNAAEGFPIGFISGTLVNTTSPLVRVNFKNDALFSVTAAMSTSLPGLQYQGYTTSYGDLGKAIIDGGTTGSSYVLLTLGFYTHYFCDMIFDHNGSTGSAQGIDCAAAESFMFERCVIRNMKGSGLLGGARLFECEAYGNGGVGMGSGTSAFRCISHDNTGDGFGSSIGVYVDCIADSNGGNGFHCNFSALLMVLNCNAYNNTGSGIRRSNSSSGRALIENCNLVKNGAYGIDCEGNGNDKSGFIKNCGFGAGTQANVSGTINSNGTGGLTVSGSVTYAADVTPWVDPANGDFRINLTAAKGAGNGAFTQLAASYAGTVGYPDIGAAQHQDAGGGGGGMLAANLRGNMQ